MVVLLFGCMWKDIQQGGNRIIKRSLRGIRTWQKMDLLELRLKVLSGRDQHKYPYLKRVCCMLWTKFPVPVYWCLPLQSEDLEQLFIVYCRVKPYIRFMYRECSYYSQMIIHNVSRLHSSLLTKVQQTCTLPVTCCFVMKQSFHVKGSSIRTKRTWGP
ncbi:hypothetical protein TNCV_871841 [Trichonephila clavipes]|nr:hypothetical protein TNCV_871841 [Trichonephila clavipes]